MGFFDRLFGKASKQTKTRADRESFDEKLVRVLELEGGAYELRRHIQPQELEQEFGQEIYTRGNKYCSPSEITYAIYRGQKRIMYVRLWDKYSEYAHKANRQIKEFCESHGVICVDFFQYMPNEPAYMSERIREKMMAQLRN